MCARTRAHLVLYVCASYRSYNPSFSPFFVPHEGRETTRSATLILEYVCTNAPWQWPPLSGAICHTKFQRNFSEISCHEKRSIQIGSQKFVGVAGLKVPP